MAQRLVRVLCPECKERYQPAPDELPDDFPIDARIDLWLHRPKGCERCRNTGFRGRIGIYELLVANEEIRQLATQRVSSQVIKQAAIRAGMRTLRDDVGKRPWPESLRWRKWFEPPKLIKEHA